jgi:hypothetical protein
LLLFVQAVEEKIVDISGIEVADVELGTSRLKSTAVFA